MKKLLLLFMVTMITSTSGLALPPSPLNCENCLDAYVACLRNYPSQICVSNFLACRLAGCTNV
jgi:hypothetical protein